MEEKVENTTEQTSENCHILHNRWGVNAPHSLIEKRRFRQTITGTLDNNTSISEELTRVLSQNERKILETASFLLGTNPNSSVQQEIPRARRSIFSKKEIQDVPCKKKSSLTVPIDDFVVRAVHRVSVPLVKESVIESCIPNALVEWLNQNNTSNEKENLHSTKASMSSMDSIDSTHTKIDRLSKEISLQEGQETNESLSSDQPLNLRNSIQIHRIVNARRSSILLGPSKSRLLRHSTTLTSDLLTHSQNNIQNEIFNSEENVENSLEYSLLVSMKHNSRIKVSGMQKSVSDAPNLEMCVEEPNESFSQVRHIEPNTSNPAIPESTNMNNQVHLLSGNQCEEFKRPDPMTTEQIQHRFQKRTRILENRKVTSVIAMSSGLHARWKMIRMRYPWIRILMAFGGENVVI